MQQLFVRYNVQKATHVVRYKLTINRVMKAQRRADEVVKTGRGSTPAAVYSTISRGHVHGKKNSRSYMPTR